MIFLPSIKIENNKSCLKKSIKLKDLNSFFFKHFYTKIPKFKFQNFAITCHWKFIYKNNIFLNFIKKAITKKVTALYIFLFIFI